MWSLFATISTAGDGPETGGNQSLLISMRKENALTTPREAPISCPPSQRRKTEGTLKKHDEGRHIIDRPLRFTDQRQRLTLEYVRVHYDPNAQDICIAPQMIVVHWTASSSLRAAFSTFDPETLPFWRWELRKGGKVNVSAHFVIDRDGAIYQLMPDNWLARHTIGLNHIAIGIENVGSPRHPLTEQQLEANAWLVHRLAQKYPAIQFLIGHYEYLQFRNTPLWKEALAGYETRKQDPGPEFMKRLRQRVQDIHLLGQYG
jgi:N-acetylmuramoyl-L-alanine amidase